MSEHRLLKNVLSWDHFSVYLSGPIDFDGDRGIAWRKEWTNRLVDIGFKPEQIFNPCHKPLPQGQFDFDYDNEAQILREYREKGDYKGLCEVMGQIAHLDLRLVDKSDLILVNFSKVSRSRAQPLMEMFNEGWADLGLARWSKAVPLTNSFHNLLDLYLNTWIPTYGTVHEIITARNQHKPVFVVWEGGIETCSAWIMWLVGYKNVFDSFDGVRDRLLGMAAGEDAYNAKDWLFFDFGQ